jgi:hypothetical protein
LHLACSRVFALPALHLVFNPNADLLLAEKEPPAGCDDHRVVRKQLEDRVRVSCDQRGLASLQRAAAPRPLRVRGLTKDRPIAVVIRDIVERVGRNRFRNGARLSGRGHSRVQIGLELIARGSLED